MLESAYWFNTKKIWGGDILLILRFCRAQQQTLRRSAVSLSISVFKVRIRALATVKQNRTMHLSKLMSFPLSLLTLSSEPRPSVSKISSLSVIVNLPSSTKSLLRSLRAILTPWVHLPLLLRNLVLNMWLNKNDFPTLCLPIWATTNSLISFPLAYFFKSATYSFINGWSSASCILRFSPSMSSKDSPELTYLLKPCLSLSKNKLFAYVWLINLVWSNLSWIVELCPFLAATA